MRKLFYLLLLLFALPAWSQSSLVTATVIDSDGTNWANGTWEVNFRANPDYPNPNIYNINGAPLNKNVLHQQGTMDNSGFLSMSIYDSTQISPSGSGWTLQICPQASAPCGTYIFSTTSSVMNISAGVNSVIPVVRFKPVAGSYGYNDAEAVIQLQPGSTYYNVTLQTQRYYFAGAWTSGNIPAGISCTGSGASQVCTFPGTVQAAFTPLLTGIKEWFDNTFLCKVYRGRINVRDCGASPGASAATNAAAFQAAVATQAITSAVITCPDGVYPITTFTINNQYSAFEAFDKTQPFGSAVGSGCWLKGTQSGTMVSVAYNKGTNLMWDGINFDLNSIATTGLSLDNVFYPHIKNTSFTGGPTCSIEPCPAYITGGGVIGLDLTADTFLGNARAFDFQAGYDSGNTVSTTVALYGCNVCAMTGSTEQTKLGMRMTGYWTIIGKNDIESALSAPAKGVVDMDETTINPRTGSLFVFFGGLTYIGNYYEGAYASPLISTANGATNHILIRCANTCFTLDVTGNPQSNGNGYSAGSSFVQIETRPWNVNIRGNYTQFWESFVKFTNVGGPQKNGSYNIDANYYGDLVTGATQGTVSLTLSGGALSAITVLTNGSGYIGTPALSFTGGNCSVQPVAWLTQSAGALTGASTIVRAGTGCDGTLAATVAGGINLGTQGGAMLPITAVSANNISPSTQIWTDQVNGLSFKGRAVQFMANTITNGTTTLDLSRANEFVNISGTSTITSVSNAGVGRPLLFKNRAGTLTLSNAVFHLALGADYSIPAGKSILFWVDDQGTIAEVGNTSSPAAGSVPTPVTGWGVWSPTLNTPSTSGNGAFIVAANNVTVYPLFLTQGVSISNAKLQIGTAVAATTCDVGWYTSSGTLVANTGGFSAAATGVITSAITQGTVILQPGWYYMASTCSNTGVAVYGMLFLANGVSAVGRNAGLGANAATAGVLPATLGAVTGNGPATLLNVYWYF